MPQRRISLKEAVKFHGHLGPYLILGIIVGEMALKKLRSRKYFGLMVKVWGANEKPKSCLIDGLQLSTGATYGKGNIQKLDGASVRIECSNRANNKKIKFIFKDILIQWLNEAKAHRDAELLAKKLFHISPLRIFELSTINTEP